MSSYFHKPIKNAPVKRRRATVHSWSLYLSLSLGFLIAYGFVAAAQHHFRAMDLGYQSEELKRQRTKLELDQRKLTLELERRIAPQRLDERAQQQGLVLPSAKQAVGARPAASSVD